MMFVYKDQQSVGLISFSLTEQYQVLVSLASLQLGLHFPHFVGITRLTVGAFIRGAQRAGAVQSENIRVHHRIIYPI